MAETPSTMLPLGTPLPPLRLADTVSGRTVDVADEARGKKGVLVAFLCNHCPYVKHIRAEFVRLAHAAMDRGFAVLAVSPNDARAYPDDGPGPMRAMAVGEGWRFPYLHDESQEAARAYHAACTPDLFLFDAQGRLAYRGEFDDSRPSNGRPVTGSALAAAIDAVAEGRAPPGEQRPAVGCSIKWRR
jgi:peroxiredoxin